MNYVINVDSTTQRINRVRDEGAKALRNCGLHYVVGKMHYAIACNLIHNPGFYASFTLENRVCKNVSI